MLPRRGLDPRTKRNESRKQAVTMSVVNLMSNVESVIAVNSVYSESYSARFNDEADVLFSPAAEEKCPRSRLKCCK